MRFIKDTIKLILIIPLLLLGIGLCYNLLMAYFHFIAQPVSDFLFTFMEGANPTNPIDILKVVFSFTIWAIIFSPFLVVLSAFDYNPIQTITVNKR